MRLFSQNQSPLRCTRAGYSLVVHVKGLPDPALFTSVARLSGEPAHTVVAVDVGPEVPFESYEGVLDQLAESPGVLRLVPARPDCTSTLDLGSRLAERFGRTVLAHSGHALAVAGGGLYVPPGDGAGWLRFEPGLGPMEHSRRFPRPRWECEALARPRRLGPGAVIEPLPAGAWIHPGVDTPTARAYRGQLISSLPPDARLPRIVLGYPGAPVTPTAPIAELWRSLPSGLYPALRFARLGRLDHPGPASSYGQVLADAVDAPLIAGNGVRLTVPGTAGGIEVCTLLPEGAMSWNPYVGDLGYVPARTTGGVAADPVAIDSRSPLPGLRQSRPGVFEYGEDAVVEITQSGLWMRPAAEPADGARVRATPPEPGHTKVVFDDSSKETAHRMRRLARELIGRLEPQVRAVARLLSASALAEEQRAAGFDSPAPQTSAPWTPAPAQDGRASASVDQEPDQAAERPTEQVSDHAAGHRAQVVAVSAPGQGVALASADGVAGPAQPDLDETVRLVVQADTPAIELPMQFGTVQDGDIESPWDEGVAVAGAVAEATLAEPGSQQPASRPSESRPPQPTAPFDPEPGQAPPFPTMAAAVSAASTAPVEGGGSRLDPTAAPPAAAGIAAQRPDRGFEPISYPSLSLVSAPPGLPSAAGPQVGAAARPAAPPASAPAQPTMSAPSAPAIPSVPAADGLRAPVASAAPASFAPTVRPAPSAPAAPPQDPTALPLPAAGAAAPRASIPAARPGQAAPAAAPALAPAPATGPATPPAAPRPSSGPRVQPVPAPQASAILPAAGIGRERIWLRRNLNKQFDAAASSVARVLSEYPGLRAGTTAGNSDVLTDLVAVRLYLTGQTRELDDAVRAASVGPHVPLARCVTSGLRRLPSYRGATRLRVDIGEDVWVWYGGRRLVTEWSFLPVLTTGTAELSGSVDILVWSMTARRTNLIDPGAPDQAVFLPGTNFKVLRADREQGPEILLRELTHTEVAEDGTVRAQEALDARALSALDEAAAAWRRAGADTGGGAEAADRYASPPGLIHRRGGARSTAVARARRAPATANQEGHAS